MRRLRIAIVTPGFVIHRDDPGMPAVVDLVERLAAIHDCHVVALRYPPPRPSYVVAGATVQAVGAGTAGALGRGAVLGRGVRAVLGIHRKKPVDLVHALWADEAGAAATIAARLLRRPVIVSVLGGELARLAEIRYGAALGLGGRWTVQIALRYADLVTAGSTSARDLLLEHRAEAGVVLLPLGVDVSLFRPADEPPPEHGKILFVGSLEPVKDPAAMLRVFGAVAVGRPLLRLDVAGDGSLRPDLERLSERIGIRDRVRFLGQLPRAQMPDLYRSASLLAVTSRHEGQSMAAVEAAAAGLPVVGTRVGILADLGTAALTVPVGDEAGLATALAAVLDDPHLAARMGAAARAEAMARFNLDRTAAGVLDRYRALVTRSTAGTTSRPS
jgi:glycosyltransferase involved in cell wall biosynthesis